jgi:phage terminase large subunit-like protein
MIDDREAAIEAARIEAEIEAEHGTVDIQRVVVCQGPPWCYGSNGCAWCTVVTIHPDGRVVRAEPPLPV